MKKLSAILLATCSLSLIAPQWTWAQEAAAVDQATLLESLPADIQQALAEMNLPAAQFGAAVAAIVALPADQQLAIAQLPVAQRTGVVSAVVEVRSAVLGNNAGALTAAMGRLNAAVATLPPAARGAMAVAVAANVQSAVQSLPPTSPVRTVAASAIQGIGQIAVTNGASTQQVAAIQEVAAATQLEADDASPLIGTVDETVTNPSGSATNL